MVTHDHWSAPNMAETTKQDGGPTVNRQAWRGTGAVGTDRADVSRPTQTPAQPASVVEYGGRRMAIIVGVMLAALLQTLDSTITNVALPNIQGNLGATVEEGTWVVNGYTIAVVIIIPMIPWFQTMLGRKRYYLACIAGFTVASFACGTATSISELILFRIVQGTFGAGLLATSQTILRDTFPPEQLAASQGIFALGAILGPALGPPLGGVLVDNYNWNWVFDINIVPGIASFLILLLFLRDPAPPRSAGVDIPGFIMLSVGIGSLQYLLSEGERYEWFADQNNVIFGALALLGIGGLMWWELRVRQPLVNLRVFRYRAVWAGFVLALAIGGALLGSTYTLPQFTQGALGFTATQSGLLFLTRAVPIALMTPLIAGRLRRTDPRLFIGMGFILIAVGNISQAFVTTLQSEFWTFALPLALTGAGAAMLFVPLSTAVLGGVPRVVGAEASAFVNLGIQIGGSITIAALTTLIDRRETFHSSVLAAHVNLHSLAYQQLATQPNALQEAASAVYLQSTILSFADASLALGVVAVIAIGFAILLPKPRRGVAGGMSE
jgi:DHA2 family multidrug resistance protein